MNKYEHCCQCGERTGKAGKGEDSLYLQNGVGPYCETCFEPFNALEVEIADLRTRCEKAEKDAERYRWLRQQHESNLTKVHVRLDEFTLTHRLDPHIDAAIAKERT